MKLLEMLLCAGLVAAFVLYWTVRLVCTRDAKAPEKNRTPEEVKARKKAYRKRKAAKAARRRNRR